ncbi:oxidoreductase [Azospirillum agricola]|uniref:oxidoreductase n=1 Tax=Azospirillum agricola TaxID=1720247 RepID=UPI000A0F3B13|nr:oxidoreductase [Azospirillum agricola]SMH36056.1 scyllo-inositol 2-dehydrogenase (NADP+) [Azospirillum lipoferum]
MPQPSTPSSTTPSSAAPPSAAPLSVGLLGFGLAGAVFHAPLIRSEPRLRLAAVASSRTDDIRRVAPGAVAVAAPEAILADPAIDLVVVATPNTSHAPLARAALLAGKHVVIDKPMAATAREADALIELAERQGRVLTVFHNRRWDGDFLTARACVEDGSLGEIHHCEVHFDRFRPAIKPGWRERPLPGSGVLFDLGAHLIDQALTLFGPPRTVTADVGAQRRAAEVDDWFHLILGYGRMRAILHAGTVVCRPGPRIQIHGDRGSFLKHGLDGQEAALRAGATPGGPDWGRDDPALHGILHLADGSEQVVETLAGDYPAFYRGVVAAILDGAPPPVTAHSARDVMLVLEACVRSAAERRTVALP